MTKAPELSLATAAGREIVKSPMGPAGTGSTFQFLALFWLLAQVPVENADYAYVSVSQANLLHLSVNQTQQS